MGGVSVELSDAHALELNASVAVIGEGETHLRLEAGHCLLRRVGGRIRGADQRRADLRTERVRVRVAAFERRLVGLGER
jgi:hypothetical protein